MSDQVSTFRVHKAQPVRGYEVVDDVHIIIGGAGEFPHLDDFAESDRLQGIDAGLILHALRSSLPGSTLDRLFALLAMERSSRLLVSTADLDLGQVPTPLLRRGLSLAQSLLLSWAQAHVRDDSSGVALGAVAWLEDQLHGQGAASSVPSGDRAEPPSVVAPEASQPLLGAGEAGDDLPPVGYMTWRDLHRRLDELARGAGDPEVRRALDHEVVMRIDDEDGTVFHCGGLTSVDVEAGCGEDPALMLDGTTRLLCDDLVAFSHGQLSGGRAASFRRHLVVCPRCMTGLLEEFKTLTHLKAGLLVDGLREDHRALLGIFTREARQDVDASARMRAIAVEAALSALSGGLPLRVEVATVLLSLRRSWLAEADPPLLAASLDALMEVLGLRFEAWSTRHAPALEDVDAAPGVRLAGCTCGWRVPDGSRDLADAFDLHAADAWADEVDAAHEDCPACGHAETPVAGADEPVDG